MSTEPDQELSDWRPCKCRGQYRLGYANGVPILTHTFPMCTRYLAVATSEDAVRYSSENRAAVGDHRGTSN